MLTVRAALVNQSLRPSIMEVFTRLAHLTSRSKKNGKKEIINLYSEHNKGPETVGLLPKHVTMFVDPHNQGGSGKIRRRE
eukprot:15356702-Ditylum_brightwellii.AAC.1